MTDWLAQLCAHVGVHASYRGFEGQTVPVSRDTQSAVLRTMGLEAQTQADAQTILTDLRAQDAARPLPTEVIVHANTPATLTLTHPADWRLEAEGSGAILAQGRGKAGAQLKLPTLPMGIHALHMTAGGAEFTTWVLARPARAVQLPDFVGQGRIWGVTAALYGMTDGDAALLGSYELMGRYAQALGGFGSDFLGINPVHAMGQVRPDDVISPYSPSHRGFLNTWHCAGPSAGSAADLIDYPAALDANAKALADQFAWFETQPADAPQRASFDRFVAQSGAPLQDFVLFEVLSTQLGPDWRQWPAPYRDADDKTLLEFATLHAREITQVTWAQWQAETQLAAAQDAARAGGMRLGLYLDLAVGPRLGGAETWGKDSALITGATLGAPPDPLGPDGQSWGLAPLCPRRCRTTGFAGFARLLRATMRHAGMIRIDHILGLMRSFWIPEGGAEGTYVSYPVDALLAVVAIESQRNGAVVVGEDLGLVPAGLRDKLADHGIYGLDVLQYMRTPTGGFADTADARPLALCTFATHDTPTVAGFFAAEDAEARHRLGSIDDATLAQTRADRTRAQATLGTADPVATVHRHLAGARAAMVAVQLDDIAGCTAQQNLPGTVDSHPNWQRKAPLTVEGVETSTALSQLAKDMAAFGRSNLNDEMETQDDLSDH